LALGRRSCLASGSYANAIVAGPMRGQGSATEKGRQGRHFVIRSGSFRNR
jgi:hypothetical protein